MKTQKGLAVLATLSLLGLSVACNSGGGGSSSGGAVVSDRYSEGFQAGKKEGYSEGYEVGYDDGYLDGDEAGFARAKEYFASADYLKGFDEGLAQGTALGYNQGYGVGKREGEVIGYENGYNDGDADGYDRGLGEGYDLGYDDGYDDGAASDTGAYEAGYTAGYSDGESDGYELGYDDGTTDGYEIGYDDGFYDGYDVGYEDGWVDAEDYWGLSVGKTKKLKGYADVLSMVHNDLVDYSKIKAPQQTKRGLVANGRLLLSETSQTNKDTLKRAAVVEQYLVVEMAKQVKVKFGLSAERSFKVAKASNHFRKFSSNRALTKEDTNAYASEIIGADFETIAKAYEGSMKGDFGAFQSVMEKAALKNGTSPEKMTEIVTKLFI